MTVISITRDPPMNVCIVRMGIDGNLNQVLVPGYVVEQEPVIRKIVKGTWRWFYSDVLLISADDTTGFFQFSDPSLTTLIPISESDINRGSKYSVYVATDGNDTTGNGSISTPYRTLAYALSTINDASQTNSYDIIMGSGTFIETNQIRIKPWVNITSPTYSCLIFNSMDIILDPLWAVNVPNDTLFFNISIFGNVNLDFSILTASNPCFLGINNCNFIGTFSFDGSSSNSCQLINYSSQFGTFNFDNASLDSYLNSYTQYNISQKTIQSFCGIKNVSDSLNSNVVLGGATSGTNSQSYRIFSSNIQGLLSIDGSTASLTIDAISYKQPTITNGATVNLISISNGLLANYTPSNYTPDPSGTTSPIDSVAAHLHGIDNALSGVTTSFSQTRYVSVLGSDITGNGSIEKPWQTIAFAMNSITTASSTNTFNVVLLDGVYNESIQILLKPWVNLSGQTRSTIINNSLDIILDSTTWNSSVNGTISIENLTINSNLLLDYSTLTADSPIVYINNIQVASNFLFEGNSGNSATLFIRSSFIEGATINNANAISFSNYYFNMFNSGTTAFIASTNYFSNGDYYNAGATLTGASSGGTSQNFNIRASFLDDLSINGSNATLYTDVVSYVYGTTISGGAILNLTSAANGLLVEFSPSNYTPVDVSVNGNLQGIDNILADFNSGNKSLGTTTNDNAVAGHIGEYIFSSVLIGSAISLATNTASNITSISLTAGDWDVRGSGIFVAGVGGVSTIEECAISTTSSTFPTAGSENNISGGSVPLSSLGHISFEVGSTRISLSTTTTVYLLARSTFSAGTMSAYGFIGARRVR